MDRVLAILATLGAGALVAFQPPANALMGRAVGALGATFVSLLISLGIIGVLLLVTGGFGRLSGLAEFEPVWVLGGIAGAVIVSVSLVTVGYLGAGGVVAATVCTQLIVSAVLDRLGVLGLPMAQLSPARVLGFGLLIAGTLLVTLRY